MTGDWTLTATGEVTRIDRENIDKSGRNPRFMLSFVLRTETLDAPEGTTLPAELAIRIADRELARLSPTTPAVGERVTMTARANGPRPTSFYLTSVRRL
jgi:hypothetical protein